MANGTYDFSVSWGDGSSGRVTGYDAPEASHQYAAEGVYEVEIIGTIEGWDMTPIPEEVLADYDSALAAPLSLQTNAGRMLLEVKRWGPLAFGDTDSQFALLWVRITAPDSPDLSRTSSLRGVLLKSDIGNADLRPWDVSPITDMNYAFMDQVDTQPLVSSWDTSSVTTTSGMFASALYFNDDLSAWDVSQATDMSDMFHWAANFNGNVSPWDTGNVETMRSMFFEAFDFNQPVGGWDVSSVRDFWGMFLLAREFDQDISGWDTSRSVSFDFMFALARAFNQDVSGWSTSNVSSFHDMFYDAASLTKICLVGM